ncbi:hypothetical protein PVAND_004747 [Polypedilum vanderplanki]|uniref:glutathione transferase n=1 Tax=Polypedilum vanderplanki TaxID=319348 RepID=A0A9J6BY62_POLVA|nr:hypothetical protein PVAND_004747 [Polypedilum vanderplanki]
MSLTLYYAPPSPPSRTVLLTLMNLGLDYESKLINTMASEHKTEEFLQLNPQGTIPVVVHDDFVMNESRAICAYLVNALAPNHSLYPEDPKLRFIIDQRMFYDASSFTASLYTALTPIMRKGQTVIQPEHKDKIISCLQTLEGFLEGFEWFSTTENPCIADLSILASFSTIYHAGLDIADFPNIAAWYERCSSLAGFEENEKGAKMFGLMLKNKLTEPF